MDLPCQFRRVHHDILGRMASCTDPDDVDIGTACLELIHLSAISVYGDVSRDYPDKVYLPKDIVEDLGVHLTKVAGRYGVTVVSEFSEDDENAPRLVLVRGLPGSGKSTLARGLSEYTHLEADMYFVRDGEYVFNKEALGQAHDWCLSSTKAHLAAGRNVVVSNTFTRIWEMQRYLDLAEALRIKPLIVEAKGNWPSVHGVSPETIERMRERWEPFN
jgi:hypothetical protein